MQSTIPYIFILVHNRPIYLWVCLDSIYRHTNYPCKIIIADNNSSDPLVEKIIKGFERRGLFYKIHKFKENDPKRLKKIVEHYWDEITDYFVFIEADIEILPLPNSCWLSKMVYHMENNLNLAGVGSVVYHPDFVSIKKARELRPDLSDEELNFLIKANAPMRQYKPVDKPLIEPHNPPLRLLMMRKNAFKKIKFGTDHVMYEQLKAKGYDVQISTEIVHRHLSLLNIYDYSDYSKKERDIFFNKQNI